NKENIFSIIIVFVLASLYSLTRNIDIIKYSEENTIIIIIDVKFIFVFLIINPS
ncbi:MAG: hypothetical protein HRT99_03155, partial [Mycoplasmatales bacterium]|nr:hypothetical protein [Mycoplasmatales bacterium]